MQLYFIDPGKPTQNAYIESFNGRFREECLNLNWFVNLAKAERIVEDWRVDYNENRPHSALNYQTPEEFAASRPFHKTQWALTRSGDWQAWRFANAHPFQLVALLR